MPKSKRHPARRPQQRTPRRPHPAASTRAQSAAPAAGGGGRRTLEARSLPLLVRLHRMPRWVVVIGLAALLLLGLLLPTRWAGLLLLVVAAFLGWLLALSWPLLSAGGRGVRALAVLVVLGAGLARLAGLA